MGISGFFGKTNLSGVIVDIEFPQEIYAGKEFPLKVTLKNKKRILPVFLMRLNIDGHTAFFPYVETKSQAVRYVNISFPKRGRYEIKGLYIYSVFPFNFFTRFKRLDSVFNFIVFPELKTCTLLALYEKEKRIRGEKTSDSAGYETDIISIREYVYGDPLKYINWKATAKTGKLKTKELSSLFYQPIIIDFNKLSIRDIEERISCVAYSLIQVIKNNMPIGLKIQDKIFQPDVSQSHKINMLRELALYENN